jgi:hypothetical protein
MSHAGVSRGESRGKRNSQRRRVALTSSPDDLGSRLPQICHSIVSTHNGMDHISDSNVAANPWTHDIDLTSYKKVAHISHKIKFISDLRVIEVCSRING